MSEIEQPPDHCFICYDESQPLIKHCRCQISHTECLQKLIEYQKIYSCKICRYQYDIAIIKDIPIKYIRNPKIDLEKSLEWGNLLYVLLLMTHWNILAYPYNYFNLGNYPSLGVIYGIITFSIIMIIKDLSNTKYPHQYLREISFWGLFLVLNNIIHYLNLLVKWCIKKNKLNNLLSDDEKDEVIFNIVKYIGLILINLTMIEIIFRISCKVRFPYLRILVPVLIIMIMSYLLTYFGLDLSFSEKLIRKIIIRDL